MNNHNDAVKTSCLTSTIFPPRVLLDQYASLAAMGWHLVPLWAVVPYIGPDGSPWVYHLRDKSNCPLAEADSQVGKVPAVCWTERTTPPTRDEISYWMWRYGWFEPSGLGTAPGTVRGFLLQQCGMAVRLDLSGLVCIDVDPRNGGDESLARLIAENGPFPASVEEATGSSPPGRHIFFRAPPAATENNWPASIPLASGVELLSGRHLVIIHGTVHRHGGGYQHAVQRSPWEIDLGKDPEYQKEGQS